MGTSVDRRLPFGMPALRINLSLCLFYNHQNVHSGIRAEMDDWHSRREEMTVREGITTVYWRYLGLACRTQVSSLRESCEEESSHGQFKFLLKMQVLHMHAL